MHKSVRAIPSRVIGKARASAPLSGHLICHQVQIMSWGHSGGWRGMIRRVQRYGLHANHGRTDRAAGLVIQ